MTQINSQCMFCKFFNAQRRDANTCEAFPEGIPQELLLNEADHRKPYPEDHDVQFEALEGFSHPMNQ